jgi:hypothetical protein
LEQELFRFIESIKDKHWLSMLQGIDAVLLRLSRAPIPGSPHYSRLVLSDTEFMFFLIAARKYLLADGRARPDAMADSDFMLLRPLCEHLVQIGRFPPERLECFDSAPHWPAQPAAANPVPRPVR